MREHGPRGSGLREPDDVLCDDPEAVGEPLRFVVEAELAGGRLDAVLSKLADVPRAEVRRWIDADRVRVGGSAARPSRKLAGGDVIEATPPEPTATDVVAEAIDLPIVFEDEHLVVVDKPAGLVVHPAPGHPTGTLVNALLHHCGDLSGIGGVLRPGIVHRLDRGTSGIMVVAKSDVAHRGLAAQFHDHDIERLYQTFVRGVPRQEEGVVDAPIGRHPIDRKKMSTHTRSGRPAVTRWSVVTRFEACGVGELEIRPETGRTHQIRVHLASAGLPILGDPVYGKAKLPGLAIALSRPALHARVLGFEHPVRKERMRFEAALPSDLVELRRALSEREGS